MRIMPRSVGFVLLVGLGFAVDVLAQSAQVSGRVADASESSVPGATVTAVNEGTGLRRASTSNSEGYYAIPALPPGPYRVTADLSGFAKSIRRGLVLLDATGGRLAL